MKKNPGVVFFDVSRVDSENYQVLVFREGPGVKAYGAELCIVSAYGEYDEDNPDATLGSDGDACQSPVRARSIANEIASAFNGGAIAAGVFDDTIPERINK